jgi:hypothetical protein
MVENRRWQPVVCSAKCPSAVGWPITMSTHVVILSKGRNSKGCSDNCHNAERFDVHGRSSMNAEKLRYRRRLFQVRECSPNISFSFDPSVVFDHRCSGLARTHPGLRKVWPRRRVQEKAINPRHCWVLAVLEFDPVL